jgi:hypothetical protein
MRKSVLVILACIGFSIPLRSIGVKRDSSIVYFPQNRLFPVVFLDPLECQTNGGSYFLFRKENDLSLYSVVNLGFTKPVIAKKGESLSWEMNIGAATFTQFDLIYKDNSTYLAGLLNNDYKISADLSIQKSNDLLRIRVFHVSSHLGDDYMLRHNDSVPNDKSVNYEQVDLTWLRQKGSDYLYAGIGEIYTRYAFRKRFSLQGGGLLNFSSSKPVNLFTSVNIKLFAENDFRPDIRSAFGVAFNRKSEPLFRIWLEYYSGRLPYSTLEYGRVNWLGLTIWINMR